MWSIIVKMRAFWILALRMRHVHVSRKQLNIRLALPENLVLWPLEHAVVRYVTEATYGKNLCGNFKYCVWSKTDRRGVAITLFLAVYIDCWPLLSMPAMSEWLRTWWMTRSLQHRYAWYIQYPWLKSTVYNEGFLSVCKTLPVYNNHYCVTAQL